LPPRSGLERGDFVLGSKREELNVSKSSPLYPCPASTEQTNTSQKGTGLVRYNKGALFDDLVGAA